MKSLVSDLYDKIDVDFLGVEMLYKFIGGFGSTTCCQQIVVDKIHIIWLDRIDMHFDGVNAILLAEGFLDDCCWQLSRFSCHYETTT